MAPSFDGIEMFGPAPWFEGPEQLADAQVNSYPGVDGVELIALGGRGGVTRVRGVLAGETADDLAAAEGVLRGYAKSLAACVLVDDLGQAWPAVVLTRWRPVGPVDLDAYGVSSRDYEAEFTHLV